MGAWNIDSHTKANLGGGFQAEFTNLSDDRNSSPGTCRWISHGSNSMTKTKLQSHQEKRPDSTL